MDVAIYAAQVCMPSLPLSSFQMSIPLPPCQLHKYSHSSTSFARLYLKTGSLYVCETGFLSGFSLYILEYLFRVYFKLLNVFHSQMLKPTHLHTLIPNYTSPHHKSPGGSRVSLAQSNHSGPGPGPFIEPYLSRRPICKSW